MKIIKEKQKYTHEVFSVTCARFSMGVTGTYYTFDNYDIDDDMGKCKKGISNYEETIARITRRKEEIKKEGIDTLWEIDAGGGAFYDDTWWYYDGNSVASIDGHSEYYFDNGEHGELRER